MSGKLNFGDQWRVKLENNQVKGPFPTESVCKMIVEGILSGQEQICKHPNGEWKSLDKQPEFYEALLESLENPVERDEKKAQKMEAETVIQSAQGLNKKTNSDDASGEAELSNEFKEKLKQLVENELKQQSAPTPISKPIVTIDQKNTGNALIAARDEQVTIELNQLKKIQASEARKFFPFVVIIIFLIIGGYFFLFEKTEQTLGWVLLAPNRSAEYTPLPDAEVKTLKARAVGLLKAGTLESTRTAQRPLIQIIEGTKNDLEALGLLCVVYEQLWPYTKQTTSDIKAITVVTQMARSINPISSYSDTCQSVYLLSKGQPKDARGLIEKTLDQNNEQRFILYPFLYQMKGQLLEDNLNYINAEAYYAEAVKSFPGWTWAMFSQARMLYKQNKLNEAQDLYLGILRTKPEYKPALYGVGLTQIKLQLNPDKALQYFTKGFAIEGKLPKSFQVEALQEFIKILLSRGDKVKALEVAQFGLTISPLHTYFKETVVSLGGEDRGNNQAAELVFLGDQFSRSGDLLAAQAQYKAAFEFDKTNGTIALKAAKALWSINQTREALVWVDRAIAADKKVAAAYALKADYLTKKFNFVEADKALADGLKNTGANQEIVKAQALVEYRKNNLLASITYGTKALKMYDADVELLTILANANINLFLSATARDKDEDLKKQKYIDDAQRLASKAVDLEPGWPEAQITYSKYLFASKGSIPAENNFKKLIETYPYTIEYRIGLAEFYESQEKYKSASEIYIQLVETDPKNKKALMGLARCYQYMNENKLAQKYYMMAAILDPSDVEPLFATAQLELSSVTSRDAMAIIASAYKKFKMVKEINPNYPKISYFMARCHFEIGEFDKAIEMINEEKKKNPKLADPYLLAATVYNAKEQYRECAAEYSMGIKLRPTSADLYVKAAICYRKSEAIDIAQDMLDIAKQKENGYAPIYREEGFILELQGNRGDALKKFKLYIELSPNALDRSQIEAKISSLGG